MQQAILMTKTTIVLLLSHDNYLRSDCAIISSNSLQNPFALLFFTGLGGRQILGELQTFCKLSARMFYSSFNNLPERNKFLPSLGGCSPPAPTSYAYAFLANYALIGSGIIGSIYCTIGFFFSHILPIFCKQ